MNEAMYQMALQKNLKTSLQMIDCSIFMQDVASCNTAKSIKALLSASKVPGWQLNLLKGLKVNKLGAARNLDELTNKIKKVWKNLSKDERLLTNLTYSMPNRIDCCQWRCHLLLKS